MAKATKKTSTGSSSKPHAQASPAKGRTSASAKPQVVMSLTHDQIAAKAYDIWLAKGRPLGQDEQNWREAEAALNGAVKV